MEIIEKIEDMRACTRRAKLGGMKVGFVPTMGYLHEGHMSLVKAAKDECGIVVLSIYVNPVQFGPSEDLGRYPRDIRRDKALSEAGGTDVLFIPRDEEIYPEGYSTFVDVEGYLTKTLCGASRPGHFKGVATIVAKLFNVIDPDISYFGQKDAQQAVVIKKMVKDLNMNTQIRVMPIVREEDTLAMSSRNTYLPPAQRSRALNIYRSLERAKDIIQAGEHSTDNVKREMEKVLVGAGDLSIDYVEIVDPESLETVDHIEDDILIMVAVHIGKVRLIDNVVVKYKVQG